MFGKMDESPAPPETIPNYIREGLDRQGTDTLEAIIGYCEARIEWLSERPVTDEAELHGDDEQLVEVEHSESGTVVIKKVTCGKSGCRCARGHLHGPYKYVVTREGESLKWEYKGRVQE